MYITFISPKWLLYSPVKLPENISTMYANSSQFHHLQRNAPEGTIPQSAADS